MRGAHRSKLTFSRGARPRRPPAAAGNGRRGRRLRSASSWFNQESFVASKSPKFEQEFLQKQRHRLMKLREELMRSIQVAQGEQTGVYAQSIGEAHEFEDD